jgi:hypothetical protein
VAGGKDTVGDLRSESGDLADSLKMNDPLRALGGWELGEGEIADFSYLREMFSKKAL